MSTTERPSWWPDLSGLDEAARARVLKHVAKRLPELRLRYVPIRPTPRQNAFLRLANDEAFYGGAAGGGKSYALLAAALQYADVPGYNALLLRRAYPDLSQPEGLIPTSREWLEGKAHWDGGERRWTFPSGATLTFGFFKHEDDFRRYMGPSYHFVGWDEMTQFEELWYRRLFSRVRRGQDKGSSPDGVRLSDVPLRVRGAANPGGVGHRWVKRHFIDDETRAPGATFIRSRLEDNPHIDEDYEAMLKRLGQVDYQRLRWGDWEATDGGYLFSNADWQLIEADAVPDPVAIVRFWDLAASEPSSSYPDPDWTAGVLMSLDTDGRFTVRDVARFRLNPGGVKAAALAAAELDGWDVPQRYEQEPGSGGKSWADELKTQAVAAGYVAGSDRPLGSKVERAAPLAAALDNSLIRVVAAHWTEEYLDELREFPNGKKDQVDASSAAHRWLLEHQGIGGSRRTTQPLPKRTAARVPTSRRLQALPRPGRRAS